MVMACCRGALQRCMHVRAFVARYGQPTRARSTNTRMTHAPGKVQWPHFALQPQLAAQGGVQQAVAALERAGEHAARGGRTERCVGDESNTAVNV